MKTLLKFTVSSLAIGTSVIGCKPAGNARPAIVSAVAPAKAELGAAKAADEARAAIAGSRFDAAIAQAELAVTLSPHSAENRSLLGQAYLKAGRFASAEQSFRDAITLDPAPSRTMLNLALAEIALGRKDAARTTLAQARGAVADADYGLALALAGDTRGAVAVLEGAARSEGAGPKTRQNLALAYALDGRWKEAQTVAAQDVPADELPARIAKWAQFAMPRQASDQIASLLGVVPAVDAGMPTRLALAPEPAVTAALAAAAPTIESGPVASEPAPAAAHYESAPIVALAAPAPVPVEIEAPRPAPVMAIARAPEQPQPAMRIGVPKPAARPIMLVSLPKSAARHNVRPDEGKFVVQIGAYSSASRVEAAWSKVRARSATLGDHSPRSTTFVSGGRTLYRLSVGGFGARAEASDLCERIHSAGGQCFVRSVAGDSPLQWAGRKMPVRLAAR